MIWKSVEPYENGGSGSSPPGKNFTNGYKKGAILSKKKEKRCFQCACYTTETIEQFTDSTKPTFRALPGPDIESFLPDN